MFKVLCVFFIIVMCSINLSMFIASGALRYHPIPKNNLMKITGFYYSSEYGKRAGEWLLDSE